MALVISLSRSTKAKEMDELSLVMRSGLRIQVGGRMKCNLVQIGLHLTSSRSCFSVYLVTEPGSNTGVLWKMTRDHLEQGVRMLCGKGWRRICATCVMRVNGTLPAKV